MEPMGSMDQLSADVVVADYAAVADGKLTLVGAGFDWFNHAGPVSFGVGVLVHVPWSETNVAHRWTLRLVDGDGQVYAGPDGVPLEISDGFEMGRPPGAPVGSPLTVALAFNLQGLVFQPGTRYVVEFSVDDSPLPLAEAGFSVRAG